MTRGWEDMPVRAAVLREDARTVQSKQSWVRLASVCTRAAELTTQTVITRTG